MLKICSRKVQNIIAFNLQQSCKTPSTENRLQKYENRNVSQISALRARGAIYNYILNKTKQ